MKPTDTVAEMKTCAKCGQLFRYPPSDNKEAETLCAYCAEPVATLPACLCGLDTNPVASPRMDIHCPKHDTPEPGGEPELPCPPHSPSGKLWHEWFDRCGEHATIEVVNATATLVIEEKKIAAEPSPTPADEEVARALVEQWIEGYDVASDDPARLAKSANYKFDLIKRITTALAEARRAGTPTTDAREPFTRDEHHELCLGVMARCYPRVGKDLQQAIREGVESAAALGIPVNTKNLEAGGPIFSGGYA